MVLGIRDCFVDPPRPVVIRDCLVIVDPLPSVLIEGELQELGTDVPAALEGTELQKRSKRRPESSDTCGSQARPQPP